MAFKIGVTASILVLLSGVTIVRGLTSCTCSNTQVWGCNFREKTVILPEEYCAASQWWLRGNFLRDIPFVEKISGKIVDISNNELGFGNVTLLDRQAPDYLDVSRNYLQSLDFLQVTVSTLIASDNAVSEIPYNVTKVLILARNNIIRFDPENSFRSTLTYLDLSWNNLASVPEAAFTNLRALQYLFLNGTQLSTLTNGTFNDLKSLTRLSLKHNKLSDLPEDIFMTLESLQELQLQFNIIDELPLGIFRNLLNLRSLNLDNNLLAALPEELFSRLHSLEALSVRGNSLTTIPSLRLCNGPIDTLLFSDNSIAELDETAVRALLRSGFLYADLNNNPLQFASTLWVYSAADVEFTTTDDCTTFGLTVTNHGSVSYCIPGQFTTTEMSTGFY